MITSLTFQDGAAAYTGASPYAGTRDTFIEQDATSRNNGTSTTLSIRDRTNDRDALIRFTGMGDGYVLAPSVASAQLTLTTSQIVSTGLNNFDLFLVNTNDSGWLEGAGGNPPAVGTGATYSHEVYNTASWNGGTRTPVALTTAANAPIASVNITGAVAGDTFAFNFSGATAMAQIQSWIAGGANGGFIILGRGADGFGGGTDTPQWDVHSREAVTAANRPKLTLNGNFAIPSDHFETYTPDVANNLAPGWTVVGDAVVTGATAQSPIQNSPSDSQGVRLNDASTSNNPSIQRGVNVASADTLYVQFDFKPTADVLNPQFRLQDTGGGTPELHLHLRGFGNGDKPQYHNGSGFQDLNTVIDNDTWYRYTLTIDPENTAGTNTFDLRIQSLADASVDDIYSNLSFRQDTADYAFVNFSYNIVASDIGGIYYLDNVLATTNANDLNFSVLAVVPEPESIALAVLGVLGLVVLLRRRQS